MSKPSVLYHYTDAGGLLGILQNRKVWASDARYLNDAQELSYARDLVLERVSKLLEDEDTSDSDGDTRGSVVRYLGDALSDSSGSFRAFVTSLCSNGDLLSMWRGYGQQGYAVGFDSGLLESQLTSPAVLQPMQYGPEADNVREMVDEVMAIQRSGHPGVHGWHKVFLELVPRLQHVKHPAFSEEQEWRLAFYVQPYEDMGIDVKHRATSVAIVPYVELGFEQPAVKSVVVGPSPHAQVRAAAVRRFLATLEYDGVDVVLSEAPFRL